jgi:copper chaperone CopZ
MIKPRSTEGLIMSASKRNTPSSVHNKTTLQLTILGMNCGACVGRITRALNELDGIDGVEINLAAKTADIIVNDADLDSDTIIAAIAEAGYQASPIALANHE